MPPLLLTPKYPHTFGVDRNRTSAAGRPANPPLLLGASRCRKMAGGGEGAMGEGAMKIHTLLKKFT